jgi:hypothetical protein
MTSFNAALKKEKRDCRSNVDALGLQPASKHSSGGVSSSLNHEVI